MQIRLLFVTCTVTFDGLGGLICKVELLLEHFYYMQPVTDAGLRGNLIRPPICKCSLPYPLCHICPRVHYANAYQSYHITSFLR